MKCTKIWKSININKLECKLHKVWGSNTNAFCININKLECKFGSPSITGDPILSININKLECKCVMYTCKLPFGEPY